MWLSDTSVKRPVFATVLSMLLVAIGALSFRDLTVRENPDTVSPTVQVQVGYPGANAEVIETRITQVLEAELSGIEGVKNIRSQSRDGQASLTVEFYLDRNLDEAANDVRDRVSRVSRRLPDDADQVSVQKADADSQPVMWLTLASSDGDEPHGSHGLHGAVSARPLRDDPWRLADQHLRLRRAVDARVDRSHGFDGAQPDRYRHRNGADARERRAACGPARVAGISTSRCASRATFKRPTTSATSSSPKAPTATWSGLGEVANVEIASRDTNRIFRTNGALTTGFGIIKASTANTVEVLDAVKAEVDEVNADLPEGMQLITSGDESLYIRAAIEEIYWTIGDHDRARRLRDLRVLGLAARDADPARDDSHLLGRDVLRARRCSGTRSIS